MANLGKNVDRCINSRRGCTWRHGIQTLNRGSAEFIQPQVAELESVA